MSCIYSQTDEDDELRKKTAERWSSKDFPIKPEDINCDGCISETVIPFCEECNVRKCGLEKGVKNCAYCTEYPVKNLRSSRTHLRCLRQRRFLMRYFTIFLLAPAF